MSDENPSQKDESPATLDDESPDSVSLNRLMVAGGIVGLGLTVILLVLLTSGGGSDEEASQTATSTAQTAPTDPQGKTFMNEGGSDYDPNDPSEESNAESSYQPSGSFQPPTQNSGAQANSSSPASSGSASRSYQRYDANRRGGSPAQQSGPSPEQQRFKAARSSDLLVLSESSAGSGNRSPAAQPSGNGQQSGAGRSTQQQVAQRLRAYRRAFGNGASQTGQRRSQPAGAAPSPASNAPPSATPPTSGQPRSQHHGAGRASPGGRNQRFQKRMSARSRESPYYQAQVTLPKSRYEVKAGTVIPAVLMTAINSELPGAVVAQVSRDVYDSRAQDHLLIPKGSKLIGEYNDQIGLGQSRLMVAWSRIIFPDGRSMQLPGLNAKDLAGATGMTGDVNRHYMRVFGSAVALSAIGAGFQLSQPEQNTGFGQSQSPQQVLAAELGRELSRVATEMIRRNMQIEPTVTIRKGYRFYVFLNKDLAFPAPYREPDSTPRFQHPSGLAVTSPRITGRLPPSDSARTTNQNESK